VQFCDARKADFCSRAMRIGQRLGLGAALGLGLAAHGANATGDTRTLSLHNIHTHEDLTITYKKNGRFDDEALKRLNGFLRDWRKDQEVRMDPELFDLIWEVHREVGSKGSIHVICGYRSPTTNAMLRGRSRSSGVAKTSLHMQGKAIDFSIPDVPIENVRAAALRLQGGGVGYYPTSGLPFVHMDVGNVRHWPRMTRDQLARVFPNGRTVHLPTDGNPMPGYELALADVERGENRRQAEPRSRGLIASLFGNRQDAEEAADNDTGRQTPPARRPAAPAAEPVKEAAKDNTKPVPLPPVRPTTIQVASAPPVQAASAPPVQAASGPTFQVASADASRPIPAPAPTARVYRAALSPNQIVAERGYWQGLVEPGPDINVSGARRAAPAQVASVDPDATAALGPLARKDRVPPEVALAYAAQAEAGAAQAYAGPASRALPATVTTQGATSVALKPMTDAHATIRPVPASDRLNDPWLRGVVMAHSLHRSLTTTLFGATDFRNLQAFMHKPAASVMMTFSGDPHLGMTTEAFTGSAVVFQATVTYGMRTAALWQ
jgi:uncharacterized protein YcbK (DUF882 family)